MKFKATQYDLMNVRTGRVFKDGEWTLSDPQDETPSLVRAVYRQTKFSPRENEKGLFRYADWLPVKRVIKKSAAPVTYKSKGLANMLGMSNLYVTFSGFWPKIGAKFQTCSFKETEAYSVLGRLPKKTSKTLVVQSAGNTAKAFARVCSDNNIPVVICVPLDNITDLWFRKPVKSCVKVIATPNGTDYYDAIRLGEKLCESPKYFLEGGAKNVARRDGMGTTLLSAAEFIGRIPDAYFQAVGSGTGAIAAWENAERLAADGRFGKNNMRVCACQNAPFTIMYDSWKARSRELLPLDPEVSRHSSEVILASVLSNRKPPYSLSGGLFDVLEASKGDMFKATNDQIVYWMLQFFNKEGIDILPAAACAVAGMSQALKEGVIGKDETVMLNITGGGILNAVKNGFVRKEADLVLSQDLDAGSIIEAVDSLF